ncbi:MAG: polysaccharide deacetylase family protein [Candidatus Riflebacteria bacterium]|nr:polysaccharide deacetylase family protein [Candidatus Riflebacteria bacterium]
MNLITCFVWLSIIFGVNFPSSLLGAQTLGKPTSQAVSLSEKLPVTEMGEIPQMPPEGEFLFYNQKYIQRTLGKNKQIILTFDDGPHPVNTPYILDVLKKLHVKAIFFVVGMNAKKYPELVKRIASEGHIIGNHTFYHLNLRHYSTERILKEIHETNDLVYSLTGIRPTLFRPPYGALNKKTIDVLRNEGMSIMLWSVDPGDWRNRNMNKTMANLRRQLAMNSGGRGGIVLMHDTLPSSAHALEPFLQALIEMGETPNEFGFGINHREKSFWTTQSPTLTHWKELEPEYRLETLECPLLTALLEKSSSDSISPVAMLKARKSPEYLKAMLCQRFR